LSVSHVVYGLRLVANVAIPGLPPQPYPAEADLRVCLGAETPPVLQFPEPLQFFYSSSETGSHEPPSLRVAMDSSQKYFIFLYSDGVRFAVENHGREVWADWPDELTLEDTCTYLLGPVMGFVLRLRGITCLHASAVALDNYAIALAGSPGAGKSTLAAVFGRYGCPVLSDDVAVLADQEGEFFVQPGYPRVNLWPDSVQTLFGSENALPRITPTWDKRYLALDQSGFRFATECRPLRVVYLLAARESTLRDPVVEDIFGGQALISLVATTYVNYLQDRNMRAREFGALGRLAANIPIRRIRPTTNPSALRDLFAVISEDARRLNAAEDSLTTTPCR